MDTLDNTQIHEILEQINALSESSLPLDDEDKSKLKELGDNLFELLHNDLEYGDSCIFYGYNNGKEGKDIVSSNLLGLAQKYIRYRNKYKNGKSFPEYAIDRCRDNANQNKKRGNGSFYDWIPDNNTDEETSYDYDVVFDDSDVTTDEEVLTNNEGDYYEIEDEEEMMDEELEIGAIAGEDYDLPINPDNDLEEKEYIAKIEAKREEKKQKLIIIKEFFKIEKLYDLWAWSICFEEEDNNNAEIIEKIKKHYEKKYGEIKDWENFLALLKQAQNIGKLAHEKLPKTWQKAHK